MKEGTYCHELTRAGEHLAAMRQWHVRGANTTLTGTFYKAAPAKGTSDAIMTEQLTETPSANLTQDQDI